MTQVAPGVMNQHLSVARELLDLRNIPSLFRHFARVEAHKEMFRRTKDIEALVEFCIRIPLGALQVPEELNKFGQLISERPPARVLEIGTFRGGTLFFLCNLALSNAHIISVDLPGGNFGGGYGLVRKPLFHRFVSEEQKLTLLRGDSHSRDTYEVVISELRQHSLDLIFIDGDHSYIGSRRDFEMYGSLVRNGGMIAFHDIIEDPSRDRGQTHLLWKELETSHHFCEIVHDRKQGWAGIGVLYA